MVVDLHEGIMVAVDGPGHSRPWLLDTEMPRHIGAFQLITLCNSNTQHYVRIIMLYMYSMSGK